MTVRKALVIGALAGSSVFPACTPQQDRLAQADASIEYSSHPQPSTNEVSKGKDAASERSTYQLLEQMANKEKMNRLSLFSPPGTLGGYIKVSEEQFAFLNKLALQGTTPNIRAAAARALGYAGDLRAVGTLTSALDDREMAVHRDASYALAHVGNHDSKELQDSVPALIKHMKSSPPGMCRVCYTLGKIDSAFEPLVSILGDKGAGEIPRIYAAEILGEKGSDAVVPLMRVLDDPNDPVRYMAIESLCRINDPRVVPAFKKLIAKLKKMKADNSTSESERARADADINRMKDFINEKR